MSGGTSMPVLLHIPSWRGHGEHYLEWWRYKGSDYPSNSTPGGFSKRYVITSLLQIVWMFGVIEAERLVFCWCSYDHKQPCSQNTSRNHCITNLPHAVRQSPGFRRPQAAVRGVGDNSPYSLQDAWVKEFREEAKCQITLFQLPDTMVSGQGTGCP